MMQNIFMLKRISLIDPWTTTAIFNFISLRITKTCINFNTWKISRFLNSIISSRDLNYKITSFIKTYFLENLILRNTILILRKLPNAIRCTYWIKNVTKISNALSQPSSIWWIFNRLQLTADRRIINISFHFY